MILIKNERLLARTRRELLKLSILMTLAIHHTAILSLLHSKISTTPNNTKIRILMAARTNLEYLNELESVHLRKSLEFSTMNTDGLRNELKSILRAKRIFKNFFKNRYISIETFLA